MPPILSGRLYLGALLAIAAGILSPQVARAGDSEIEAVIAANHAAIASRNIDRVAALWSQTPDALLCNPRDTSVGVGWTEIRGRWERVFDAVADFEITQADGPHVVVSGDVAWSTGVAHVVTQFKAGPRTDVKLVEIDVLVRRDGHWLIASHTARPI